MRVVFVASRFDHDPGCVGEAFQELGAEIEFIWRDRPTSLETAERNASALVLLASGWTVIDPDWQQEVAAEMALVRRALAADMPILAICYGAHIVASVLGASISPCDHPEVGWCMVESRHDQLCPPGEWFLFHENRWSPVPGAVPLGWSAGAPQAFRFGRALGVQFHPEATLTMIERWLELAPVRVAAVRSRPRVSRRGFHSP